MKIRCLLRFNWIRLSRKVNIRFAFNNNRPAVDIPSSRTRITIFSYTTKRTIDHTNKCRLARTCVSAVEIKVYFARHVVPLRTLKIACTVIISACTVRPKTHTYVRFIRSALLFRIKTTARSRRVHKEGFRGSPPLAKLD